MLAPHLDMVRSHTADLVVLDLGLPDMDGLDVVRQIRDGGETLPIIILSSRDNESAKVKAFDLSADDYVTTPFGIDELLARIRAAQRHRLQEEGERPLFHAGDLSIDLVRQIVTVRGNEVKLSPREYDVLRLMVAHVGKVLTHLFMLEEIWGADADVQYLRVYIRGSCANDDETNTCREFTLGGIGQTSSGYAPNQRQQRLLQQPALIRRTAGGRRSFQRRLLHRLNFWTVPVAAHSRRKTSCASLRRSTALRASPERSARSCAARGFTRRRCRTGGVSAPQAPSKR